MTPNDIDVLLHYYVSSTEHPRINSPAVKETIHNFIDNGLIQSTDVVGQHQYETTPKGSAHVAQLCALPWPTKAWIGVVGKVIDI